MKLLWITLFATIAGFALGWSVSRPSAHRAATSSPEIAPTSARTPMVQLRDGQVMLPAKDFREAVRIASMSGFTFSLYATPGKPPVQGHTPLTARLGMDETQADTFHRIIRAAVEARLAWEKAHVQVRDISPGEWELNFPGDGGAAKQQLTEDLASAFGPELTGQILLSADLDGLFEFSSLGDGFRHGTLRVRSRIQKSDTYGESDRVQVAMQWGDEVQAYHLGENTIYPDGLPWRLAAIFGGNDVLKAGAAARAEGAQSGNTIAR